MAAWLGTRRMQKKAHGREGAANIQKSTGARCEQLGAAAFVRKPAEENALRSGLSGAMGGRS
jgi:hypothetical protein